MTTLVPGPVAELLRVGSRDASTPVGVVIKVQRREDLVKAGLLADELLRFARGRLAKASIDFDLVVRQARIDELLPAFVDDLVAWFDGLLARAGVTIAKEAAEPLVDRVDWTDEGDELGKVLARFYVDLGETASEAVAGQLGLGELRFDLEAPALSKVRELLANQVTRITDTTREILRDKVEAGVTRGYSIEQIVAGVDADGFTGLRDQFGGRAKTIALTESATAYNATSLAQYRDTGLVDGVTVLDGAECGWTEHDDPDLADGSERSLDDADEYPISHPNCQRAFAPLVAR